MVTEGQVWTYNYSGGWQIFTSPASGIYDIYCYGAQGGNGNGKGRYQGSGDAGEKGTLRASRVELEEGIKLSLVVGGAGKNADVYINTSKDTGYARAGLGGWSDGSAGTVSSGNINDSDRYHAAAGGGGGGSSYVSYNNNKIISATGGRGGAARAVHAVGGPVANASGGSGGGSTSLSNTTDITWMTDALNFTTNSVRSGNGYLSITLIELSNPIFFNGEKIKKIFYNNAPVKSVYFNGIQL